MELGKQVKNYTDIKILDSKSHSLRNILLYSCILVTGIIIGVILTNLNLRAKSSNASSDEKINSIIRVVPPQN